VIGVSLRCFAFAGILFYYEGKTIIQMLFGSLWVEASIYLKLAILYTLSEMVLAMTNNIHSMVSKPNRLTITQLTRAISFFVLCGLFVYLYGYMGIITAYILASVLSASVSVYYFYRKIPFHVSGTFVVPIIISLLTCLLYQFSVGVLPITDWHLLNFILRILVMIILYLCFTGLLDLSNIKRYYLLLRG